MSLLDKVNTLPDDTASINWAGIALTVIAFLVVCYITYNVYTRLTDQE